MDVVARFLLGMVLLKLQVEIEANTERLNKGKILTLAGFMEGPV